MKAYKDKTTLRYKLIFCKKINIIYDKEAKRLIEIEIQEIVSFSFVLNSLCTKINDMIISKLYLIYLQTSIKLAGV